MAFIDNTKRMAYFDEDSFTTQNMSENNAVKYRLRLKGSNNNSTSTSPAVFINNTSQLRFAPGRGLTVVIFDSNMQYVAEKTFDTFGDTTNACNSCMIYMDSFGPGFIVAIVSRDAIRSTAAFDEFLSKKGSKSWPGTAMLSRFYRSSAVILYNTTQQQILAEGYQLTVAPNGDTSVTMDFVYDTIDDLGATGLTQFAVSDPNEYDVDNYNGPVFVEQPLTELNLAKGNILLCSYDLFTPKSVWDAGGKSRLSVNYLKGTTWVSGDAKMSTKPDTWERFEFYTTIPSSDINTLQVKAFRYPSSVTAGVVKVKNVSVSKALRADKTTGNAAIGVYGARMNKAAEIPMPPAGSRKARLLNLVVKDNPSKVFDLESTNFKEFQ
ncbi:hinge connector of long tail fiber, proxima [Serratia phage 4S]|nr:hinge connector of long tail fiber, proxima [Serratia phage 4S]